MAVRTLSSHTALVPGSPLWLLPDFESSTWTKKLDWYLNFQITKSKMHKSKELSQEQVENLREWDLPYYERSIYSEDKPLMICSEELLPNKQTVLVTYQGNLNTWFESLQKTWQELGATSIRIFLPDSVTTAEASSFFATIESPEITLVESGNQR